MNTCHLLIRKNWKVFYRCMNSAKSAIVLKTVLELLNGRIDE